MLEPVYHIELVRPNKKYPKSGTILVTLLGRIRTIFHGEKVVYQTHCYTERTRYLFCDEMERDWRAVIAEAMGDDRSVFFIPRKTHLFACFNGMNIDRYKHDQVHRNLILASELVFQNNCIIIYIYWKAHKRNTVQIKDLSRKAFLIKI